jgi:2-iminobutanoate/2-iminopropanoate deaminase
MQIINTASAPAAIGPYSQGIDLGNLVFFSGQIALTANGDFLDKTVEIQTEQVLKNISQLLIAGKLKKENIAKTTIFLANMNDFEVVNKIYANFFGEHKPARSTVEVAKLPKNAKVEIEVIAARR